MLKQSYNLQFLSNCSEYFLFRQKEVIVSSTHIVREYCYMFPVIRGIQAGREYYVTMCPLNLLPRLFKFDEEEVPSELRAQRTLNKSRVPAIKSYIMENTDNYVFSSISASIDGEVEFKPLDDGSVGGKIGTLVVPMEARFLINDGQHRRAAIEEALKENSNLGHETISVVFFVDSGLKRTQQMFSDLNRYAVRPTHSLAILYDHRDPLARLVDRLTKEVRVFKGMTETAKSTISNRSRKLFTLSSIYHATCKLIGKRNGLEVGPEDESFARDFWNEVAKQIPDWMDAQNRKVSPSELRRDFIHAHGIALQALAIAGASLIVTDPENWMRRLKKIRTIDWSRSNAAQWEGRALIGGRLSKSHNNVILTANVIKQGLELPLDPKESFVEQQHIKGKT